ncbi:MAG: UvrD-helicase domain-containing protein [Cardiobacteriaceae bacterium]|nr:UvrD-helicase domain-containing protein [Cardiobacteriaceae bacterium]
MQLNPEQLQAVQYLDGPLLVIAGAGSGKTGVITQKIAHLIKNCGYQAKEITALTFTNKAAGEMKERVREILGRASYGLRVCTFHRLGLDILQREAQSLGLRRGFSIFDQKDGRNLLRDITKSDDNSYLNAISNRISNYKNAGISPDVALEFAKNEDDALIAKIYKEYIKRLLAYNAVDFDDLILLPLQLLREKEKIRNFWQNKIRYTLVDEYQDTNDCQYELTQFLVGNTGMLTAVGDDDQSIYAWRGANTENIKRLVADFPNLKTIKLEQNYRSTPKILNAANTLISHNQHIFEKELWSDKTGGENIRIQAASTEDDEAALIVSEISWQLQLKRANPEDFAVLYRSNYQSRPVEQALRERNIPYTISGGTGFFEHSEIRDLISYLRLANNPEDDTAFLRISNTPKRGIGITTLEKLGEFARRRNSSLIVAAGSLSLEEELGRQEFKALELFANWIQNLNRETLNLLPSEVLQRVINDCEYIEYVEQISTEAQINRRKERINQLQSWIKKLEQDERRNTLDGLMQHLMLLDILDNDEGNKNAVHLMSLHAAKGLEFPQVFIIGAEEQLLPHSNSTVNEQGIEEERRLFYVGITRARENLVITRVKKRKKAGAFEQCEASRFLQELPTDGIDWLDGSREINTEKENQRAKDMFNDLKELFNS